VNIVGERGRRLERREMAAPRNPGPALNIRLHAFDERFRRRENLSWVLGVTGRDRHLPALRDDPGFMQARVIGPERRADCTGRPASALRQSYSFAQ
jgi:hypothetical protein